MTVTPSELKITWAEVIVGDIVKRYLAPAIDWNAPYAKVALQKITFEAVKALRDEGWKPPDD